MRDGGSRASGTVGSVAAKPHAPPHGAVARPVLDDTSRSLPLQNERTSQLVIVRKQATFDALQHPVDIAAHPICAEGASHPSRGACNPRLAAVPESQYSAEANRDPQQNHRHFASWSLASRMGQGFEHRADSGERDAENSVHCHDASPPCLGRPQHVTLQAVGCSLRPVDIEYRSGAFGFASHVDPPRTCP
jgi:hypothetical protein